MTKLDRTQKSLMAVQLFKVVLEIFTGTFFTSYILTSNSSNIFGAGIINVAIFYISIYVSYISSFFILSFFVDKSNRVSLLRIGIIINLVLLLVLLFMGSTVSKYVVIAGVLYGLSDGFYYPCYLVMKNELNSRKVIQRYSMFYIITSYSVKIIIPIILGFFIDASSYTQMSMYIIFVAIAQFGLTFAIKSHKPNGAKFEPFTYFKFLKENKDVQKNIKWTYLDAFVGGFKNTYEIIVIILTIYTFKTNLNLGLFTALFSLMSILIVTLYKSFDNNPKVSKKIVYSILGIIPLIVAIVLAILLNKVTLIIYNLIITISVCFCSFIEGTERDCIIKNINKYEYIAEHQFTYEAIRCLARVTAYIILIICGLFANILAFKIVLVAFVALNPIKLFIMYNQRKVRLELEKANEAKPSAN